MNKFVTYGQHLSKKRVFQEKKKILTQKVMMLNKFHLSLKLNSWRKIFDLLDEWNRTGFWFIFFKNSMSLHAFCQFFFFFCNIIWNWIQVVTYIQTSENSIFFALWVHCQCTNYLFPFSVCNASTFYTIMRLRKLLIYCSLWVILSAVI